MALTINTNLSSIITQRSLTDSTSGLSVALERLSTGFKINHAKDNAANYSISINMSTKISSYEVAQSNVEMGMDMITTADDSLDIINGHLQRIRDLCEQAASGTFGDESRQAIQAEIDQRVEEINRIQSNTEYNGIKLCQNKDTLKAELLEEKGLSDIANITANKGPNGKFIEDIIEETPQVIVSDPTQLLTAIQTKSKIGISNAETLAELATIVNSGTNNCSGKTIILTEDIDLSAYGSSYNDGKGWTPIGNGTNEFDGYLNGNGHVIKNLYINNPTAGQQGLIGYKYYGYVSNLGLEDCNITGDDKTGGICGETFRGNVNNCYVTGSIKGRANIGSIIGFHYKQKIATNCYSEATVSGRFNVGSITGWGNCTNCYSTGDVIAITDCVGGITGDGNCTNCYSTGNVTSGSYYSIGGVAGQGNCTSCYSTGDVIASNSDSVGGVTGNGNCTNCYATGDVAGKNNVGGLAGYASGTITNSVSLSSQVTGTKNVGSFVGVNNGTCTDCVTTNNEPSLVGSGNSDGITYVDLDKDITIQVGIDASENSRISFKTGLNLGILSFDVSTDETSRACLDTVDDLLTTVSTKQTELGAVQNRLSGALESIKVSSDNLISSRSTLRDADVAEESSRYIQMQILQQASATLLATANQSPSIALSLI